MSLELSPASAARTARRHLERGGYTVIVRPDGAYLCETNRRVEAGAIAVVRPLQRLVCRIDSGDNVWGLRHTRAQRTHDDLDEELRRRLAAPTAARQYALDEASAEFRERYMATFVRRQY